MVRRACANSAQQMFYNIRGYTAQKKKMKEVCKEAGHDGQKGPFIPFLVLYSLLAWHEGKIEDLKKTDNRTASRTPSIGCALSFSCLSHGCHTESEPGDYLHASNGRGIHLSGPRNKIYYSCTSMHAPIAILGERPLEMGGKKKKKEGSIDADWTI